MVKVTRGHMVLLVFQLILAVTNYDMCMPLVVRINFG
jgi:hypothetical protein